MYILDWNFLFILIGYEIFVKLFKNYFVSRCEEEEAHKNALSPSTKKSHQNLHSQYVILKYRMYERPKHLEVAYLKGQKSLGRRERA